MLIKFIKSKDGQQKGGKPQLIKIHEIYCVKLLELHLCLDFIKI